MGLGGVMSDERGRMDDIGGESGGDRKEVTEASVDTACRPEMG